MRVSSETFSRSLSRWADSCAIRASPAVDHVLGEPRLPAHRRGPRGEDRLGHLGPPAALGREAPIEKLLGGRVAFGEREPRLRRRRSRSGPHRGTGPWLPDAAADASRSAVCSTRNAWRMCSPAISSWNDWVLSSSKSWRSWKRRPTPITVTPASSAKVIAKPILSLFAREGFTESEPAALH